jgi:hypothetical protein
VPARPRIIALDRRTAPPVVASLLRILVDIRTSPFT